MLFTERSQWDSGLICQMEERTDSNALPFRVQTMRILLIRFFPLIDRVKPADTVIILPSVLSQSIHKRKAQLHPIFIMRGYINGTLFYLPNNTFHIILHLIIYRGNTWCMCLLYFRRDILPILGGKYFLRHHLCIYG